ncbi:MAG: exodeoxyribonuclease VII small subunit [Acidimicrobiales bacterium]
MTDPAAAPDAGLSTGDVLLDGDGQPLAYAAAAEELETIVASIESADVDVDELGRQVGRASELIRHCRARLREVQTEVDAVVDQLVDPQDAP